MTGVGHNERLEGLSLQVFPSTRVVQSLQCKYMCIVSSKKATGRRGLPFPTCHVP